MTRGITQPAHAVMNYECTTTNPKWNSNSQTFISVGSLLLPGDFAQSGCASTSLYKANNSMFSVECLSEYTKTWALMFTFIKINFLKLSLGFMNCISYLTIIIILWFSIWSFRRHWHKTVSFNCKVFLLSSQPTNRHFCTLCLCIKQLETESEHTQWTQKTAFDWKSSYADWEETLPLQLC